MEQIQRRRIVELEGIVKQFRVVEDQIRAGYKQLIVGNVDEGERIIREVLIGWPLN